MLLCAVTAVLIKDLCILLYSYLLFYLNLYGDSNMVVLTSNERMSATTIFSLYFNLDKNVTGPSMKRVQHIEKTSKSLFMLYFHFQRSCFFSMEYTLMHIFTSLDL